MDETTRTEIQRVAARTLRDAGLTEPALSVERLLEHVNLYRDYYDLSDPSFLDRAKHKLKIHGRRLVEIVNKVRLRAVPLTVTRVERGRIWFEGTLDGRDLGPIVVPVEISSRCKVGWTISGVVGRRGRRWQLVEAWNVYPR